jgi:transcriptional regulator with XRE-family HTH domain
MKSSYFGKLLREERKKLGLTQAQAAEVLGIAKKTLENWECDRHPVLTITQEGALARLFSYSSELTNR